MAKARFGGLFFYGAWMRTHYVSGDNLFYGPLRANKAYRRMVVEARTNKWVEILRKGFAWHLVAAQETTN